LYVARTGAVPGHEHFSRPQREPSHPASTAKPD
jgi:hypothetical protein